MADDTSTRKRVRFDPENLVEVKKPKFDEDNDEEPVNVVKNKKHTLDSDEEDEDNEINEYDVNEIEGQEDATVARDGDIEIMPFNMNEDMKEGYFNEEGEFIYKKNKDEEDAHDAWLDSVNWESVKNKDVEDNENTTADDIVIINGVEICEKLLGYFKNDKSTLDQVLKKINSEKNLTAAEERKLRWAAKKSGSTFTNPKSEEVNTLTSLVENLISLGHQEAYSYNKDKVSEALEQYEIEKELADRKERMQKSAMQSNKQQMSADLIAALDDDDEEGIDEQVEEEKTTA